MQVKVSDPRVDTNPIRGVVHVSKKGVGTRMTCQHKVSSQSPPRTAYQILESVRTRIPGPVRINIQKVGINHLKSRLEGDPIESYSSPMKASNKTKRHALSARVKEETHAMQCLVPLLYPQVRSHCILHDARVHG